MAGTAPGRKHMKAESTLVSLRGEPISRRGLIVSAAAASLAADILKPLGLGCVRVVNCGPRAENAP